MTTLPISIPSDFTVIVKKGDKVEKDNILAKAPESPVEPTTNETSVDLVAVFNESANSVRKYLRKGPGDSVHDGEIIASRSRSLGLKNDSVISHLDGTIIRFERDTGKLIIQSDKGGVSSPVEKNADILSPLDGTIKVCNNDSIVIVPDDKEAKIPKPEEQEDELIAILPKTIAGEKGIGGKAKGFVLVLSPGQEGKNITSTDITKDAIGKILVLPDIEREAVAKAAAIGVAGILGTDLSVGLFDYVLDRKIDLPIISIEQGMGKKLIKSKKEITINGKDQTVTDED